MQDTMIAEEAIEYVLRRFEFTSVLDVGAGQGLHAEHFRKNGKFVVTLDSSEHWGKSDIVTPFLEYEPHDQFDLVWCSHVLEHQVNPNLFLKKIFSLLKPGGIYAITVPPLRTNIVGGHVSVWNAGLLAYHLILANFDCRDLAIKQYGYNISVIGRKRYAELPTLHMDRGDIERLAVYFPVQAHQKFDGNIQKANWRDDKDRRPIASSALTSEALKAVELKSKESPFETDRDNLVWSRDCISIPGFVAEFGVYKGKSLTLMAEGLPNQTVYGFDSFVGLPEQWLRSEKSVYEVGHFKLSTIPSNLPDNVRLVPGFFDQTILHWKSIVGGSAAFIHIDADLYSSAKYVLQTLDDRIVPGTILVFDELCDWKDSGVYPRWPEGEWKALMEWITKFGRTVRFLSRGPDFSASFIVVK